LTAAVLLAALSAVAGCVSIAMLVGDVLAERLPRFRFRLPFARAWPGTDEPRWRRFKLAGALTAALLAALAFSGSPVRLFALLVMAATAAGYATPDMWLARQSRRRIEVALGDLPDMLDLLRVALGAGAPTLRALALVAGEFDGPLALEWRRVCAEAELGVPRETALNGLVERLPHDELRSFADTLRRGHRHGTSLADALAAQATRTRHAQAHRLRERAARAGPKIQLVVALVLVPSVLLLLVAGLVAELERSGLAFPS
jgi:tight adherence protein C